MVLAEIDEEDSEDRERRKDKAAAEVDPADMEASIVRPIVDESADLKERYQIIQEAERRMI